MRRVRRAKGGCVSRCVRGAFASSAPGGTSRLARAGWAVEQAVRTASLVLYGHEQVRVSRKARL